MKECVVVLGMHRSGTSALTGLVSLFGGYVGSDLMRPTKDNPRGYFENNKIYLLNEKILRENKTSWDDYTFVVEDIQNGKFQEYVSEAKKVIEGELKYVKRLIIKDPRICILFPIWEQALNELDIKIQLIFAYRSPLEVAHSLLKRDEMPVEKGLMLWSHYFLQSEFYSRSYQRMIVEYDNDFRDLPAFLDIIGDFIGVEVSEDIKQKAKDFYSPKLKHHQVALDNISDDLPLYLIQLLQLLVDKKLGMKKKLNQIRAEFFNSKKYYQYNQKHQEEELATKEEEILQLDEKLNELERNLEEKALQITAKEDLLLLKKEEIEDGNEKLKELEKAAYKKEKGLIAMIDERDSDIREKEKGLERLNSGYILGDQIFQKLVTNKRFYDKLHNKVGKVSRLKLKSKLLFFAKKGTKRSIRERILIIESGLFSPFFYLTINPDVKESGIDPLTHFCRHGWKEGRNPSLYFDTATYLKKNPDVERVKINPLLHYIKSGKKEGREVDSVVLYGKRNNAFSKPEFVMTNYNNNGEKLFGPILEGRWETLLTAIEILKRKKKTVDNNIPLQLIEFSKDQLEKFPLTVSVVMPTWNRENSICQAIDSILAQSYLPFEIIVSDDGSTDNTIDILKRNYSSEISGDLIKIIENEHQGVSSTRNSALKEVTGDLIAYLDSDNLWRKDYLLIMAASLSECDELNCAYSALKSYDKNNNHKKIRATAYNRKQLIDSNFIDLNVFVHRKVVFDQFGGFDTQLKRLVDWELIIRFTKNYTPAFIPFVGVDYFLDDKNLKNITTTVSLDNNRQHVYHRHFQERVRYGLEVLRIAYVLWDFPALSQTFVMEELKWLVEQGHDVKVYYSVTPDKSANLDFDIDAHLVKDADELAELLEEHQRNLCHTHFAYPTTTLLTYPACLKTNTYFTFMPHAVDIFHHENKKRNKIGEIAEHPLCLKVLVHGEFHKKFIEDCGVPSEKIAFNIQAVNIADFEKHKRPQSQNEDKKFILRGIVISRFVEKKGLNTLFEAAAMLKDEEVVFDIYGYGPLEEDYKKQINELGLDNVLLRGPLTSQSEVAKAYEESDFLIAPCVVAKNGDMDGFPTVILEAMAVGLPVITTDIAAIPDYLTDGVEALVATAGDIDQIAERVRRLIAMQPERKMAMIKRSQEFLDKKIGVKRTMKMLLDTWQAYSLDIFLVTFNTEDYDDQKETFEIISRIFKYTTTPFTLTIVDNNSDEKFWSELCDRVKGYTNVRLIRKYENQFCGPASNIALELSDSEFAIYICSKEGFIKKHGWERTLLDHMRSNPNTAMAGHHSQMPKYIYGREYKNHPDFSKFRNPGFARDNPDRVFKHVQGGVFIISREFIKEHGGFNPATPHGGMDIEMSYYVESLGYGLGEIPEVASLTVKTLPKLPAILNERTVVAHPLTIESVIDDLDTLDKAKGQRCNICGWKGGLFGVEMGDRKLKQKCPKCQSTGFGRSILKLLANNHHIYRGESCAILSDDPSLEKSLGKLFKLLLVTEDDGLFLSKLKDSESQIDCIIVDPELMSNLRSSEVWQKMFEKLSPLGEMIFADSFFLGDEQNEGGSKSTDIVIQNLLSSLNNQHSIEYIDFTSYCIAYDWRRFGRISSI